MFGQLDSIYSSGFANSSLSSLYNMGGPRSIQFALKLSF
jgi:hypothetical protein